MATDVSLTELFNGEKEVTSLNNNNSSPEADKRLSDGKEEQSERLAMKLGTEK